MNDQMIKDNMPWTATSQPPTRNSQNVEHTTTGMVTPMTPQTKQTNMLLTFLLHQTKQTSMLLRLLLHFCVIFVTNTRCSCRFPRYNRFCYDRFPRYERFGCDRFSRHDGVRYDFKQEPLRYAFCHFDIFVHSVILSFWGITTTVHFVALTRTLLCALLDQNI